MTEHWALSHVARQISNRYTSLFNSIIALASPTDEAMLFGSLTRLRTEMARLVVAQAGKIKDTPQREAFTSTIYDGLVQRLRVSLFCSPLLLSQS